MITEQIIEVTLRDGKVRGEVTVQDEPVRVVLKDAGPPGPQGPQGEPGPIGPPGNSENAISYVHQQMSPDEVWTIAHNLNFYPGGILVQDAAGTTFEGEVEYLDSNTVRLSFLAGFSGTAYLS